MRWIKLKYRTRRLTSIFISPLMIIGFLVVGSSSCLQFRMSSEELEDYLSEGTIIPEIKTYQVEEREIRFVETGHDTMPLVVFIHGAPGSSENFVDYLKDSALLSRAKLIAIDRAGYGFSGYGKGETSLKKQAGYLRPAIDHGSPDRKTILVGHGYGSAVAVQCALDNPDLIDHLVLISPCLDHKEESKYWIRYILQIPIFKWVIPKSFYVANKEIYFLKDELKNMEGSLQNIKIPVSVIHGNEDLFVSEKNVDFIRKNIRNPENSYLIIEEGDHYIPWKNKDEVCKSILTIL